MTLVDLVERISNYQLRKMTAREYSGACPFCQAGDDRFRVWPGEGRYWCRVCNRSGDDIQFLRDYKSHTFTQAREMLGYHTETHSYIARENRVTQTSNISSPPSAQWQERAQRFVDECHQHLLVHRTNPSALAWLSRRELQKETLSRYAIGYNPRDRYEYRSTWGLPPQHDSQGRHRSIWLPRGIVIPWQIGGGLWGIRIRRPTGEPKYVWVSGGAVGLFLADNVTVNKPVMVVEGEFDALTVLQVAGDTIAPVATGSTSGARRTRWLARIATTPLTLIAYDADKAGDAAAEFWLRSLPNAKRWRPYWSDVNELAMSGVDLRAWISAGLAGHLCTHPVARRQ